MYWTSGQLSNRMYRTHAAVFGGDPRGVTWQILTPDPLPPKCRLRVRNSSSAAEYSPCAMVKCTSKATRDGRRFKSTWLFPGFFLFLVGCSNVFWFQSAFLYFSQYCVHVSNKCQSVLCERSWTRRVFTRRLRIKTWLIEPNRDWTSSDSWLRILVSRSFECDERFPAFVRKRQVNI